MTAAKHSPPLQHPIFDDGRKREISALPAPSRPPLPENLDERPRRLWLALELPWLPLERFAGTAAPDIPFAVSEYLDGTTRVVLCNRAALHGGARPGMRLSGAHALLPRLAVRSRDPAAERAALERLAAWAGRFTPQVVVESPGALLLEVAGSERLFGGLDGIVRTIRQGVLALGYRPRIAVAPTPSGALLLAGRGETRLIRGRDALRRALAELELTRSGLPKDTLERLRRLGLKRFGELLRMPREGVARRYGEELMAYLDRALGRLPDPRKPFHPPERYHGRLPLPAEEVGHDRLLAAAGRLISELAGFLEARGVGVQELTWSLFHREGEPSRLTLKLGSPGRDAERLTNLLAERLERFELPSPVIELELLGGPPHPLASSHDGLFNDRISRRDASRLLERLVARLGEPAVRGVEAVADHRPERAWRPVLPGRARLTLPSPARPLWLLAAPRPLPWINGRPHYRGELHLLRGPERIESGWWDGAKVERDYFAAENPAGVRLWIFREPHKPDRWFLHGRFG